MRIVAWVERRWSCLNCCMELPTTVVILMGRRVLLRAVLLHRDWIHTGENVLEMAIRFWCCNS